MLVLYYRVGETQGGYTLGEVLKQAIIKPLS